MSFFPKTEKDADSLNLLKRDILKVVQQLEIGDCINLMLNDDLQGRFILLGVNEDELTVEFTNAQRFQNISIQDIVYIEKAPNPAFPVSGQKLGAAYHITLYGVCDQAHRNDLLREIDTVTQLGLQHVILRCGGLTGISSTGIALLITIYTKLNKRDIDMCLVNTVDHVKKVLHNSAVDTIFDVF